MTSIRQRFHFTLLPVALCLLGVTLVGYSRNEYVGDFFSYFVALNNLVDKGSFSAFPYYENILGVHSYLTLPLLVPLVRLCQSPVIFPLVSLVLWYLSSSLFFEICLNLNSRDRFQSASSLPFLCGCLFFSFPLFIHFSAPVHDPFQPDFFLVPALLSLFFAMLIHNRFLFYTSFVLLLLTKEEFIVLAPAFMLWLWLLHSLLNGMICGKKIDLIVLLALFLSVTLGVGIILSHFRALNSINFFSRTGLFPHLIWERNNLSIAISALSRQLGSVSPYLAFLFYKSDRRAMLVLALTFLVFPVARELLNISVYPEGLWFYMHSRIVLVPTVLLTVAVVTFYLKEKQRLSFRSIKYGLMLTIALNIAFGVLLKGSVRDKLIHALAGPREFEERSEQVDTIRQLVRETVTVNEVLILPEELYPWFYQRGNLLPSYALYPWQKFHPLDKKLSPFHFLEKLKSQVRFIILDRLDSEEFKKRIAEDFKQIGSTAAYLIFLKNPGRWSTSSAKRQLGDNTLSLMEDL